MHRQLGLTLALVALVALSLSCPAKEEGGKCKDASGCVGNLACVNERCQVDSRFVEKMAKQSGVKVEGERVTTNPNAAGGVRVRQATAGHQAFAVCASDERLIGGWCSPSSDGSGDSTSVTEQRLMGYSKSDTIGAQWNCQLRDERVTAFAMCQKVAAFQPEQQKEQPPLVPDRKSP